MTVTVYSFSILARYPHGVEDLAKVSRLLLSPCVTESFTIQYGRVGEPESTTRSTPLRHRADLWKEGRGEGARGDGDGEGPRNCRAASAPPPPPKLIAFARNIARVPLRRLGRREKSRGEFSRGPIRRDTVSRRSTRLSIARNSVPGQARAEKSRDFHENRRFPVSGKPRATCIHVPRSRLVRKARNNDDRFDSAMHTVSKQRDVSRFRTAR